MKYKFDITGIGCQACSSRIQNGVSKMEGVKTCEVNLLTNSMEVETDTVKIEDIIGKVVDLGYGCELKKDCPSR